MKFVVDKWLSHKFQLIAYYPSITYNIPHKTILYLFVIISFSLTLATLQLRKWNIYISLRRIKTRNKYSYHLKFKHMN